MSSRALQREDIRDEIARLRMMARDIAGPAVMSLVEKRTFLARVVRARPALHEPDSDLWQSIKHTRHGGIIYRLPNKIEAITEDTELAGHDTEAAGYDSLAQWLAKLRK